MKNNKSEKEKTPLEIMIAQGTINVLALGYKGVEAWRSKRNLEIPVKNEKKD